jgi:hypothetical protein
MDEHERHRQRIRVRQAALRKLGAVNIYCFCGEDDPLCFEADHIYRRDLDGICYAICKNHHAKRSARGWSEHPPVRGGDRSPEQRNEHLLLGVADYLEFIAPLLRKAAEVGRDRPRDSNTE